MATAYRVVGVTGCRRQRWLGQFKSGKGAIFDLQLSSPDVFVDGTRAVSLLAPLSRTGFTLDERFGTTVDGLQDGLTAPLAATWYDDELEIVSGALVIAIAYNATPAVDADTSGLDPQCFSPSTPRLPAQAPTMPVWTDEPVGAHELAIVPVENGRYRVSVGTLSLGGSPVARFTMTRSA